MKSVRSKIVSAAAGRSWWLSEEARLRGEAPDAQWSEDEPGVVYLEGTAHSRDLICAVAGDLAQTPAPRVPRAAHTGAVTQAILDVLTRSAAPLTARQVADTLKQPCNKTRSMLDHLATEGRVEKHKEGPNSLDRVTFSRLIPF